MIWIEEDIKEGVNVYILYENYIIVKESDSSQFRLLDEDTFSLGKSLSRKEMSDFFTSFCAEP